MEQSSDFNIERNKDGDFTTNREGADKQDNKAQEGGKKKGAPQKTSGNHQEGQYDKQSDKPTMQPGTTDERDII
ncbi:MAG: hypothetical protein V4649_09405 [Bacteroidota bacterium]